MDSEEILYQDRAKLRELHQQHPEYTISQLIQAANPTITLLLSDLNPIVVSSLILRTLPA